MMWSHIVRAALVWVKTTRWRKASKCKNLIMQVQVRLTIQKKRKYSILRQSRDDISELLQNGNIMLALPRVERLYKDKCLLVAYDQIDNFCDCIITNFSHIIKCSSVLNLPVNVTEALASLTYAASRCGELSELHLIRNLFRERFGRAFDIENVELSAGNFVNSQLKQNLGIHAVSEDEKLKLMTEFTCLEFKDSEQNVKPEHEKPELKEMEMQEICSDIVMGEKPVDQQGIKGKYAKKELESWVKFNLVNLLRGMHRRRRIISRC